MLGRALKLAFWVIYDHLGKLALLSVVTAFGWATTLFLFISGAIRFADAHPLALGSLLVVWFTIAFWSFIALVDFAARLIEFGDAPLRDYVYALRRHVLKGAASGVSLAVAGFALVFSLLFYVNQIPALGVWLGYALSAATVWLLFLVGAAALYLAPALVHKSGGLLAKFRLSAVLSFANPFYSIGLCLTVGSGALLACAFPPLLFLLFPAFAAVVIASGYEVLSHHYRGETDAALGPALEDYLNRGLRDVLFPWKS